MHNKGSNCNSIAVVHQPGGYDVTCKPSLTYSFITIFRQRVVPEVDRRWRKNRVGSSTTSNLSSSSRSGTVSSTDSSSDEEEKIKKRREEKKRDKRREKKKRRGRDKNMVQQIDKVDGEVCMISQ